MVDAEKADYLLALILRERERQERLRQEGRFKHTLNEVLIQEPEKLAVIMEEVGEIGKNVLRRAYLVSDGDPSTPALLDELLQTAALCLAWGEALVELPTHRRPER
jgi:hypothetical protein